MAKKSIDNCWELLSRMREGETLTIRTVGERSYDCRLHPSGDSVRHPAHVRLARANLIVRTHHEVRKVAEYEVNRESYIIK